MKKINKNLIINIFVVSLVFVLAGPAVVFAAGPAAVNLGTAGNFVILSKAGISTIGSTAITGDIGVSPIAATAITGFGPTMDVSNTFSTSALVTGKIYAADYTAPTPTTMTTAVSNMETAYTDAAGRTNPTATELGEGNIGGRTLAPGLYKWSTGVTIPTDVTLSGSANDVWIFQVAQNLDLSSAAHIILTGGAQASNIFWQVAGQTTLGTTSVFNGNILDQTAVVLNTGATLNGRALAQTEVTLDSNAVTAPLSAYPRLDSIAVDTTSATINYTVGAPLDLTGLVVTGTYTIDADGSKNTKVEQITAENITGFDSATSVNGKVLTVTVDGKTTTYSINVAVADAPLSAYPRLDSIAVDTTSATINYTVGAPLDLTGLVVTGTYTIDADGSKNTKVEQITAENITGFDPLKVGNQVLTINVIGFDGSPVTYTVNVAASPVIVSNTTGNGASHGGGGGGSSRAPAPVIGQVLGATTSTVPATGQVLGASTYQFTSYIRQGASSDAVKQLQERLRAEGFFTFPTSTGFFGPITRAAVQAYQTAHGIPATGFVGPLTLAALNSNSPVANNTCPNGMTFVSNCTTK